jgi:hypothetical protein
VDLSDIRSIDEARRFKPRFCFGVFQWPDAVAVADASGVLVMDVKTGEVRLDWSDDAIGWASDPSAGSDAGRHGTLSSAFEVDDGHFRLDGPPGFDGCEGAMRQGRIFKPCGTKLVWFAGRSVLVLDARPWRVEAVGRYEPGGDAKHARDSKRAARIPVGPYALSVDGWSYN